MKHESYPDDDDKQQLLQQLKLQWIQEQYHVASQVRVRPDPEPLRIFHYFGGHDDDGDHHSDHDDDGDHETHVVENDHPQQRFIEIDMNDDNDNDDDDIINNNNNSIENDVHQKSSIRNSNSNSNSNSNNTIESRRRTRKYYGGVDVSFPEPSSSSSPHIDEAVAVYVILEYPSMSIVYQEYTYFQLTIPYIPTFLAFREIGPVQALIQQQRYTHPHLTPAVILVDGNGIFHPRHAGLACFVGVRTGIPTIGIGKTLFCQEGHTNERVRRTIHQSIRDYCRGESRHCHLPECVVTFDCRVDPPMSSSSSSSSLSLSNPNNNNNNHDDDNCPIPRDDRAVLMMELSQKCSGLAIPIMGTLLPHLSCHRHQMMTDDHHHDVPPLPGSTPNYHVIAYALVGHGGRVVGRSRRVPGTSQAIYISVGHDISLQEAVRVVCRLSWSRIPEPVRRADLYGRALWRERTRGTTTATTTSTTTTRTTTK